MGVDIRCLGTESDARLTCGWVGVVRGTGKVGPHPGVSGSLARAKSKALEKMARPAQRSQHLWSNNNPSHT